MDQSRTDFNVVFGSEAGKRVLEELLSFSHVLEAPVMESDPHVVMFKAGRRDVAMYILEKMKLASLTEVLTDDN